MADRRMFAKTIIDSDAFLNMPLSTQALYFHLSMRADDEGFVNNPRMIQRMVGALDDDFRVLISKNFIIPFESGIVVIKHWKIHNYIQNDRFHPTNYTTEKAQLDTTETKAYVLKEGVDTTCIQPVSKLDTQVRLGKDRVVEDSVGKDNDRAKARFAPPTFEEVQAYCNERKNNIDPQYFIDYYSARGWELKPGQKVKDWKACVRTWEKNNYGGRKDGKRESDLGKAESKWAWVDHPI